MRSTMFIAMAAVGGAKTNVPQNIGGQTGKFAGHREKPRYEYVVFRAYDSIGDLEAALLDGTLDFAHDLNGFSPGDFLSEEHFHPPRLPWGAVLNSLSKLEQLAATPPTTVANLTRPTRFMYAHAHVLIAPFPFSSLSLLPVDALFLLTRPPSLILTSPFFGARPQVHHGLPAPADLCRRYHLDPLPPRHRHAPDSRLQRHVPQLLPDAIAIAAARAAGRRHPRRRHCCRRPLRRRLPPLPLLLG